MSNQYTLQPGGKQPGLQSILKEANHHTRKKLKPGDVSPEDTAPVLLLQNGKQVARPMRWGFPNFRNEGAIYAARAETAEKRSTFRKSLEEQRCIIPSTGFYDKLYTGADEPRYLFNLLGTQALYMAGIYNSYKNDAGKEAYYFAMLTTPASASVEKFNQRMPVVLRKNEFTTWLNGNYESLFNRGDITLRHRKIDA